jgi:hypothetical protein
MFLAAKILIVVVTILLIVFKFRKAFRSTGRSGFIKVEIPRTAETPLDMGLRLDVAAALKDAGGDVDELRKLIEAGADAELLRRYWALKDRP